MRSAASLTGAFGVSELDQSLLVEVASIKYRNQSTIDKVRVHLLDL